MPCIEVLSHNAIRCIRHKKREIFSTFLRAKNHKTFPMQKFIEVNVIKLPNNAHCESLTFENLLHEGPICNIFLKSNN